MACCINQLSIIFKQIAHHVNSDRIWCSYIKCPISNVSCIIVKSGVRSCYSKIEIWLAICCSSVPFKPPIDCILLGSIEVVDNLFVVRIIIWDSRDYWAHQSVNSLWAGVSDWERFRENSGLSECFCLWIWVLEDSWGWISVHEIDIIIPSLKYSSLGSRAASYSKIESGRTWSLCIGTPGKISLFSRIINKKFILD